MRHCSVCIHPDREAIEAELLGGVLSFRTVAGRHGLSSSALHRHRNKHLDAYTVGDLLPPASKYLFLDDWRRWDGKQWLPCPRPRLTDLIKVNRPGDGVYDIDPISGFLLSHGIYRLRKTKRRTS